MAHGVKLEDLSMEDLQSLISDAQKALSAKVSAERSELIKKLEALDAIDKPIRQAGNTPKTRNAPLYTYVHPDSGNKWGGRGDVPSEWKDIIPANAVAAERKKALAPYRVDVNR